MRDGWQLDECVPERIKQKPQKSLEINQPEVTWIVYPLCLVIFAIGPKHRVFWECFAWKWVTVIFREGFLCRERQNPGKKKIKNQSSGGWKCFSVHFLKSLHRKRLAEILCHHETVLEGWTEMFLEDAFHSRYMGQCVGLDFIWHYVQLLIKFHLEIDYLTLGFLFFCFFF